MPFLSPVNAIVLWHRCWALVTQWWAKHPQGYPGHLQWINPTGARIFSSYPLRPVLQAHNTPEALSSSKFLQVGDHHSLGSTVWALMGSSILCLWVFSFHLLHKPPNLTSASTAYIEKAVIENLSDCRPAKSSAITFLTHSESLSTSPLPCNLFLFALHEDTWPWFLHIHYNHFHSPLLLPQPPLLMLIPRTCKPFPICTFAHVLFFLLDDDRTYFASLQPLYYSPGKPP